MSTLASRIAELPAAKIRGWQAQVARACRIKPPSVSDWATGKTKSIDGNVLLRAAEFFQVHPRWLQSGVGPKLISDADPEQASFFDAPEPEPAPSSSRALLEGLSGKLSSMPDIERVQVVAALKHFLDNPVVIEGAIAALDRPASASAAPAPAPDVVVVVVEPEHLQDIEKKNTGLHLYRTPGFSPSITTKICDSYPCYYADMDRM